mgnify:CR=1 FL=1
MSIHPYLNVQGVAISAHRGGSLEAPENTIESFEYSLEIVSTYIETDVQLSSDVIPYIFMMMTSADYLEKILDLILCIAMK